MLTLAFIVIAATTWWEFGGWKWAPCLFGLNSYTHSILSIDQNDTLWFPSNGLKPKLQYFILKHSGIKILPRSLKFPPLSEDILILSYLSVLIELLWFPLFLYPVLAPQLFGYPIFPHLPIHSRSSSQHHFFPTLQGSSKTVGIPLVFLNLDFHSILFICFDGGGRRVRVDDF